MMTSEDILRNIYYNPSNPASFGTIEKLYTEAAKRKHIPRTVVENWLKKQITFTLHKPLRRRFPRNKIVVSKPNEQWECDIVDMKEFTKENNGFNYILTVTDSFSKFSFAYALKTKTAKEVKESFVKMFEYRMPSKIRTDRGKEFDNAIVKKFLKENGIQFFTSKDKEIKCAIVERFNRTLKSKMFKYFTANGNRKYLDVLQKLVNAYNNTVHSTTKMKPAAVTFKNSKIVFQNMYGYKSLRDMYKEIQAPSKLKVGDKVRLKYELKVFDKGYYPNWMDEIFTIAKVNLGNKRPLFTITKYNGEVVDRRFYTEEIQHVTEDLHRIEKIIKRRKYRNKLQYFVKWLNYSESHNSWINASDVNNGVQ